MTLQEFQQSIREGIPAELPAPKAYEPEINHAPKRKDILTKEEKKLAIRNALRYFGEIRAYLYVSFPSGLQDVCP